MTHTEAARYEISRCPYCDGTGDVHRADGEWLGVCEDCALLTLPSSPNHIGSQSHEL